MPEDQEDPPFPGLFPRISRLATITAPIEEESFEMEDRTEEDHCSISTNEIKAKIRQVKPEDWENANNEKFFYTNLFERTNNLANLSDFQQYDLMVHREAMIEQKVRNVMEENNDNLKVGVNFDSRYDTGADLEVNQKKRMKGPKIRHNPFDDQPQLYTTKSNNSKRTEVIDLTQEDLSKSVFSRANNNNYDYEMSSHKNYYHLQRKLQKPQIQMIALGGTLGVGLFLSSGKAFSIGGPLGCFLGFLISGSVVLATMLSFAEMSTLIPTTSSISGLASRFVEDAFGFALGWCYWLSFAIAMPGEICAGTIMLSYYNNLNIPSASTVGFPALFLTAIVTINLFDVRFYGNIEYGVSFFKVMVVVVLMFTMVAINVREHYGFRYWDRSKSTEWEIYGAFRPTFDLDDLGTGSLNGIGGALGRLLGVVSSILISSYAYTGSEIGFVASMECKNPRKALPSVTKRVFGRIVILYLLSIFLVGLNMYAGDPRLLRYYSPAKAHSVLPSEYLDHIVTKCPTSSPNDGFNGNQSPWIIALQRAGYCTFSNVLNAIFVVFAVSAGSAHLYVSSRTMYSMATQKKAPSIFGRCSKAGVPYCAVLFSGAFGLLGFLSVDTISMSVFQDFANISSATAMLMWAGMCLSFLRFYYGLKLRPDIISRDDPSYPYRSPLQPFLAIYGLLGSLLIVLLMGFIVFLKGFWDTKTFFTSYGAIMLFAICYGGYKIFRSSKIHRLDQLDLDSGRREMDRIIWGEEKYYISSLKEVVQKCISWLA